MEARGLMMSHGLVWRMTPPIGHGRRSDLHTALGIFLMRRKTTFSASDTKIYPNSILSSVYRDSDFRPGVGIVTAGGQNNSGYGPPFMDAVEISRDYGHTFEELARLPDGTKQACVVIADESTIFVAGGHSKTNAVIRDVITCIILFEST